MHHWADTVDNCCERFRAIRPSWHRISLMTGFGASASASLLSRRQDEPRRRQYVERPFVAHGQCEGCMLATDGMLDFRCLERMTLLPNVSDRQENMTRCSSDAVQARRQSSVARARTAAASVWVPRAPCADPNNVHLWRCPLSRLFSCEKSLACSTALRGLRQLQHAKSGTAGGTRRRG